MGHEIVSQAMEKEKRRVCLDWLRIFATAAVVLMHVISGVLNGGFDFTGYERRVKAFRALVDATSWSVPVFLLISGYLFLNPKRWVSWRAAFCKYCRRILLALVLFGVPFAFLEFYARVRHFEGWMLWQSVVSVATGNSWAHLWYLYLILVLYAATPLLKTLLGMVPKAVTYAFMAILVLGVSVVPFVMALGGAPKIWRLPSEGIYLFYYLCGYVFAIRKKQRGKKECLFCVVAFLIVIGSEMVLRFVDGYGIDMAYGYPLTVLAALLLFNASLCLDEIREREQPAIAAWLCPLCFGIYLIHPVFLNLFYKFLHVSLMDFRFFVGVPLFFLIAFAGSAVGTWILRMIPPMRKYVL